MTAPQSRAPFTGVPEAVGVWPEEDLERVAQCPVCASSTRTLLHDNLTDRVFYCAPGNWTSYRCSGCGSAYLDPRPTPASIGRAYAQYFTHSGHERVPVDSLSKGRWIKRALANGYRNWRFGTHSQPASALGVAFAHLIPGVRESLNVAFRHMPKASPDSRLLDIGAGNGDFLVLARLAGWDVHGVEPDPAAAAVCRDRGLDVLPGGIELLTTKGARFDFITISHVIEHVHDPKAVIARAYELLKPGGYLYIDTPNIDAYGHNRYGAAWRGLEPPRHLILFNWYSLERVLQNVGFNCITRKPRTTVYPELAARSRALAQGCDSYRAKPSLGDKITGRILAVRMPFKYQDSEFVTLLSHKSAVQQ